MQKPASLLAFFLFAINIHNDIAVRLVAFRIASHAIDARDDAVDNFALAVRHRVCVLTASVFQSPLSQFLRIALQHFCPMLNIVIDINGNIKALRVSVIKIVFR